MEGIENSPVCGGGGGGGGRGGGEGKKGEVRRGGVRKNLFCGGGMDSFWNHTDLSMSIENYVGIST